MEKKFIIANWKMNPETLAQAREILEGVSGFFSEVPEFNNSVVICPPFVFTEEVSKIMEMSSLGSRIELGAQDIALGDDKSLTGEVSGEMLNKLNVRYVIAGHSDRRYKLDETDEIVNEKIKIILRHEMVPIVCIGELKREEGYQNLLRTQIKNTFSGLSVDEIKRCLIAYEPVWAISTTPGARAATLEDALGSINIIREELGSETRVLYGGSVGADNAQEFLGISDGVLVGGASLNAEEFNKILDIAK